MIKYNQKILAGVARKYGLRFVILHGSYAVGREHQGSDLDIAVLGRREIKSQKLFKLSSELAGIFGDSQERELDLKTLHRVDPLFRYQVVRNSVLLFGNQTDYEEFKSFTYRAYEDARPLLELEHLLSQKYQKHLNQLVSRYA